MDTLLNSFNANLIIAKVEKAEIINCSYIIWQVTDVEILELLFTEVRCNVMDGTYPCSRDLIIKLAGILCAMQYGEFNEQEHTLEFYK